MDKIALRSLSQLYFGAILCHDKDMNRLITIFILLWAINVVADDELKRTLSVNSCYVETFFNSNEALVHAPLSFIQAYSKLFDVTTQGFRDSWPKRLANILLESTVAYWLSPSLSIPFHEFGHARAMHALGLPYNYGSVSYGHHFKNISNYWTLFGLRLITPPWPLPGSGLAYTSAQGSTGHLNETIYRDKGEHNGLLLMIIGAGLNNQMFLSKAIGTTIYEQNGHISYLSHYLVGKVHGAVYSALNDGSTGDPSRIVKAYHDKGISINHRHLKALSLLSLISGTTFSLLYGYYNYLVHDDNIVRPIDIFGFRLPELNGYINANGLSFEIESDYRIADDFTAGLSYEFIWRGRNIHEVTPRVRYNFASLIPSLNDFWVKASVTIGKGVGGNVNAELAPMPLDARNFWTRFSYYFDMSILHAGTLYGERNIISLNQGNIVASSAFFGLRLRY